MQKLFFIFFICLCFNSGALFAQRFRLPVGKSSKSMLRAGESSRAISTVNQAARLSQVVNRTSSAARISAKVSRLNSAVPSLSNIPELVPKKEHVVTPSIQTHLQMPLADILRPSTFMAEEFDYDDHTNTFSGTVFETVYNGKREVFGVVSAHAIATFKKERALRRSFLVMDSSWKMIPAEIVQLSSSRMLDIALVKLPAQYTEYNMPFQPLRLAQSEVKMGDIVSSQGFSRYQPVHVGERFTILSTPLSFRTTMPHPRAERFGLCGSAVVNKNNELVGIHTGSAYDRQSEQFDIGYATHASYLNKLVEAYHNGGKAIFPLILNGVETIPLNVDEYIIHIALQDEMGKLLWEKNIEDKFPYHQVQNFMEIFVPRYITFVVRRALWNPQHPEILMEDPKLNKFTEITYMYDWQNRKIVSVSRPSAQEE